ncbi:hypothetical protein [Fusibacillus kribbianus]|uniref:TraY domain-containing protein n=1 Tax=Fusibacillus kribbianus TaxID=3044208 RepID=A0AAP4F0W5_9FIRM|nr:hypothetical protein [Ruminococcus sp. YH-rum2234]MDI9242623.1 hypothetical protein [Ruminococcus sp. YH-rum2234]
MTGKYKNKTFSLRIDNRLQMKVEAIAEKEDRTITKQYERIIREYIQNYEKENGPIEIDGGGQNDET